MVLDRDNLNIVVQLDRDISLPKAFDFRFGLKTSVPNTILKP